jgi:flagellar biosynthesis protein FliP
MVEQSWLAHIGILAFLAIVPFLVVACTSFAKVTIVLGIVRNSLGGQGVIPVTVIGALSAVITLFIMGPVLDDMLDVSLPRSGTESGTESGEDASGNRADTGRIFDNAMAIYKAVSPPLIQFLRQNTPEEELTFFANLDRGKNADASSVRVLTMAFASSELLEALALGVLVLIPFLVLDLIVANTLSALGLVSLSPAAVALPLKLLLFIAADGWHLLVNALIISYGIP